ncbi:hypothetical protein J6590_032774 [Homalodisca vitripennis]|nr:hypothetical protein J6590_032774 [Homalodisca vitripennis]
MVIKLKQVLNQSSIPGLPSSNICIVDHLVIEGMDIVHKIEGQKTYEDDRPIANVNIAASGLLPLKEPFYVNDDANE